MSSHEEVVDGTVQEVDSSGQVVSEKDLTRVISGLKSTLKSSRTGDEAKAHAEERISALEAAASGSTDEESSGEQYSGKQETADVDPSGEEHDHRVIGGYKAAIHNPNVSDEKKAELKEKLDSLGVEI